ncbi:L-fuculose-phosphate aldolase [Paenibacillus sp. ACRRX]|uniref:L-fuculose-phosphate aldolase n=1 Tax=Paenibacillus sp. ACRRX TaxID=2918206 RepID=UPI001EF71EF4|nr:L-fuculose-phosphate aldolase [Paenibacillus sp. ACRRX]MCG7406957.1 L-fuculose-phosphate aldolase [Paenibacillus sp. ACRRX]
MLMEQARHELIKYGKKLVENGLTKGTGGNLSIFDRKQGTVAITPTGIDFYEIEPEDIVILDLDGNVVEGMRLPSSEWEMHLAQYKTRDDMDAVIHAHTMYSTVLSCLRWELPATHYMIAVAGPNVRVAEYATFGTHELAVNATKAMAGRKAVILANHGVLAGSQDLLNAFNIVEELEYCAQLYVLAKSVGEPIVLPDAEMHHMVEKFKSYGQRKSTV